LWILALPFYPKRCIVCGSPPPDKKSLPGYDAEAAAEKKRNVFNMVIAIIALLIIASWIFGK
jgi:hypothetical protein